MIKGIGKTDSSLFRGGETRSSQEDTILRKTSKLGQEHIPTYCKNMVASLPIPKYSSLCIYPDSSYQTHPKLSVDFFSKKAKQIVENAASQIKSAKEANSLDRSFFDRILKFLGNERAKLAIKQKSEGAEIFGQFRQVGHGDGIATPLGDFQYREYEQKILESVRHLYNAYSNELNNEGICIQEKYNDITSYFFSKMLDFKAMLKSKYSAVQRMSMGMQYIHSDVLDIAQDLQMVGMSKLQVQQILASFAYLYANTTLVLRDGKQLPGTEWFAMVPKDGLLSEQPLWADHGDRIAKLYSITVKNIPSYMEALYGIFLKCTSSTTKQEFSSALQELQYLFAHATPYNRGSAAIAEWFMQAICHAKDYLCTCVCGSIAGKCSLDLAALTSSSIAEYAAVFSQQMSVLEMHNQSKIDLTNLIA